MPLDQLRPRPAKLPIANDVVPLIQQIKFDKTFTKAFEQVFGKTVVCPNLTIAGHMLEVMLAMLSLLMVILQTKRAQ